jgi:hypothetical protein
MEMDDALAGNRRFFFEGCRRLSTPALPVSAADKRMPKPAFVAVLSTAFTPKRNSSMETSLSRYSLTLPTKISRSQLCTVVDRITHYNGIHFNVLLCSATFPLEQRIITRFASRDLRHQSPFQRLIWLPSSPPAVWARAPSSRRPRRQCAPRAPCTVSIRIPAYR